MRRAVLVLAAIVFAQTIVMPAMACDSCTLLTLKQDFKLARRVFIGRAEPAPAEGRARFTVLEPLKGVKSGEVVDVDTRSSCNRPGFQAGTIYLVFVHRQDDVPMCSHTQEANGEHAREIDTVRRRAAWWRSPFSSVTMFRWWIGAIVERFGSGR